MNRSFEKADAKSASGDIDSLEFVRRQKIYLFHGYNDAVVARSVTDAAADFYRHYLGEANRGNLYYQTTVGAGHSLAVAPDKPIDGLNDCQANAAPVYQQCGYDQAGIILQHIYGALSAPNRGPLSGTIKRFDQSLYTRPNDPGPLSLTTSGFVFVPKECEQGAACRVHIALHGCKQDVDDIGRRFIDDTGYNAWADSNRLIVLYPQTTASPFAPFNPQACWDWWSYVNHSDNYVTKSGAQIRTIKAMLDALTAGATPAAAAAPCRRARSAQGDRHVGYIGGSGVDSAGGNHGVSRLSCRRRRSVHRGGRCGWSELCRFRTDATNGLSLARLAHRQWNRRSNVQRGPGHHARRARALPEARHLSDRSITGFARCRQSGVKASDDSVETDRYDTRARLGRRTAPDAARRRVFHETRPERVDEQPPLADRRRRWPRWPADGWKRSRRRIC